MGAIAGAVVVAFRYLIGSADTLLNMIWIMVRPNLVYAWCGSDSGRGRLYVVSLLLKWDSLISGSGIPRLKAKSSGRLTKTGGGCCCQLGGGILSLGCGLSLGRRAPASSWEPWRQRAFQGLTKRVKTEEKLLITCGASAGLSAAFNAPIAGILFSLEEVHKHFHRSFSFPPWRPPSLRTLYPGMYSALSRYLPFTSPI